MAFLDRTDLEKYMRPEEIDQIIDGDATILTTVIADAEEFAAEKLRQRYVVANEYAKTGTDRNASLLKQVTAIAVFYLSERLPTNILSENRQLAFERAEEWLKDVSKGNRMVDLEQIDTANQVGLPARWGSKQTNTGSNHY